jgi:hypothetical protein
MWRCAPTNKLRVLSEVTNCGERSDVLLGSSASYGSGALRTVALPSKDGCSKRGRLLGLQSCPHHTLVDITVARFTQHSTGGGLLLECTTHYLLPRRESVKACIGVGFGDFRKDRTKLCVVSQRLRKRRVWLMSLGSTYHATYAVAGHLAPRHSHSPPPPPPPPPPPCARHDPLPP